MSKLHRIHRIALGLAPKGDEIPIETAPCACRLGVDHQEEYKAYMKRFTKYQKEAKRGLL